MSITPTGSPAWLRTVAFTDYGGNPDKENYLSRGAINPLTDVAAEEFSRMVSDLAAAVRTAPFAIITYLNNDGTPAAPTIETVYMMTGTRITPYAGGAAPSGFPSASRGGTGNVTFTFDSSYADEYGIVGAFAPRFAVASGHGATFVSPSVSITGQDVGVICYDSGGVALADKRVTLTVW